VLKRRLAAGFIVLAVAFPLSGCGGGSTSPAAGSPASASPTSSPTAASPVPSPSNTVKAVSPVSYLRVVCPAVTRYTKQIDAAGATVEKKATRDGDRGDLGGLKRDFVGFLGRSVSITRATHDVIASAGKPDISRGDTARHAILAVFQRVADRFAKIRAQAAKTDDTNASTFLKQFRGLNVKIKGANKGIGAGLNGSALNNPVMNKAAAKVPSCAALNN
jgi:hypothetical protein